MENKKCPRCGQLLKNSSRFCAKCGYTILVKNDVEIKRFATKAEYITAVVATGILSIFVAVTCSFAYKDNAVNMQGVETQPTQTVTGQPMNVVVTNPTVAPTIEPSEEPKPSRGTKSKIPQEIRELMQGRSMTENSNIGFDDLSYLRIPYINFDGEYQMGEMVVANDLAEEVLDIFEELYKIGYPIERMELVDRFFDKITDTLDTPDRASMGNNNTSAFYYRVVSGSSTLSNHAYGRAIDINAKVNPFVNGDYVSPANAYKYADRSMSDWSEVEKRAVISRDTDIYRIFTAHGWEWGGEIWSYQDYQHFQKP